MGVVSRPDQETGLNREDFCQLGHQLIDLVAEHLYHVRARAPYSPVPASIQEILTTLPLPIEGQSIDEVMATVTHYVLPYATFGIGHPRSFGYVAGGVDSLAVLGTLLAAALNPNAIGGDQAATYLEETVVRWIAELLGFPPQTGGLLVSGGSTATLTGLAAARTWFAEQMGWDVRAHGLWHCPGRLLVYASEESHSSLRKSIELLGLGHASLRIVPTDDAFRFDVSKFSGMLRADRAAGHYPFVIVGNCGSTNTGAVDPLKDLAEMCASEHLWFHIDGSYGAIASLAQHDAPLFAGLERADSLAFDPHKWLNIPYECAVLLVRDSTALTRTFSVSPQAVYLRDTSHQFADSGFQLSRAFHALKLWMSLAALGRSGIERLVQRPLALAQALATQIDSASDFECMIAPSLSIVCFRYLPRTADEATTERVNRELVPLIQRGDEAFLTSTVVRGRTCLRACILHPDTNQDDLSALLQYIRRIGEQLTHLR